MIFMIIDATYMPFVATFLFMFALIFGLLSTAGIAGFSKRVNAILALVIAFFSILYEPLVSGMQNFLPFAAIILVVIFFMIFIKKLLGGGGSVDALPVMIALGIMMIVLGVLWPKFSGYMPAGIDASNILWAIGILFVIVFFGAVYYHKEK